MNFPLFLARHIYNGRDGKRSVSRPAIAIATFGVAVGLAVMIVTVAVVFGFKKTVSDKVTGFGKHIQVTNFLTIQTSDIHPICIDDSLLAVVRAIDGVKTAERYAFAQGILKTDDDFLGITFKGVAQEYDFSFIRSSLIEGEIPTFADSTASNRLLLSKLVADKLRLKTGDRVFAYFVGDEVRARRFTVSGVYQTNMAQFDDLVCFTDLYTTRRLNGWERGQCSGAELSVTDYSRLEETAWNVAEAVNRTHDRYGQVLSSRTIKEAYPQVFSWLNLLDLNVWIILALMVCVAGFTMISGLLIIILERTRMIGTLKALGASNATIRHTFLWFATFVIGKGLVIGNILGIGLVALQMLTGVIALDPQVYYVDKAPMELNLPFILLINIATLLICILVLLAPSMVISYINPVKSIRYE